MSGLKEQQCYGLSSRKLCRGGNISVFHVKLTDSAARAIDTFQNGKGQFSHPTICFTGNQGRITIPRSENRGEARTFTFGLANVARDNPHGSFDCVQQLSNGAAEEQLSCVGVIQKKLTINATDDSYHKARQSMAQAEEETRSRGAIVIKQRGRFQGKRVTVRAPAPALASLAKPRISSQSLNNLKKGACMSKLKKGACTSDRKIISVVEKRPLRERLTHLLALRPYRRPELVLRLQKDGLMAGDKDMLDTLLLEVGQLNSRDKTYVLKDCLYKDLQKDWPGYTTGDQKLLKRILVRRLFQPHQNLLSGAQVSPLRDTPNSSPAHPHKHSLTEEYTDPLASKKPRISHLPSKTASDKSGSDQREAVKDEKVVTGSTEDDRHRNSPDPQNVFDPLSADCKQKSDVVKRLQLTPPTLEESKDPASLPQPNSDRPPSPLKAAHLDRHTRKRKKSKHKHREREKVTGRDRRERRRDHSSEDPESKASLDCTEPSGMLYDSSVLQATNDTADYLLKYTVICSHDQRQSYKQDFNEEYSEYRDLHARIDSMTRQFMELDTQLKQLRHGSHKYKTLHNQILQEYLKIKKSNPNYNRDKIRCEYLHNKLAHIKKLISEYDRQQLSMDCHCPN